MKQRTPRTIFAPVIKAAESVASPIMPSVARSVCRMLTAARAEYYVDENRDDGYDWCRRATFAVFALTKRRWEESGRNQAGWQIVIRWLCDQPWPELGPLDAIYDEDSDEAVVHGDLTDTRDLTGCEDLHDCGHVLDERRRVP